MTETHQPCVPPARGVDAVAGQPPVPLNVWYRSDDTPGDARHDLIRQAIEQYSHPGQTVLTIGVGADPGAPPWPAARRYRYLPGWRQLPDPGVPVDLILLAWAYTPDPDTGTDERGEVFGLLHAHLADAGHAVLVFDPPGPGVLHAAHAAALVAAATRAGLGYRQSIAYLDTGLRGPFLDTTRLPPGPQPWPPGWQHQAHRYLLVLSAPDDRHG
jgi:hypothetical protein